MNPIQQHIADSLEKYLGDYIFADGNRLIDDLEIKQDFKQSQLQLLEVIRGEVEELEAPYESEYDLESVHEGYFKAIEDVLDLLTIKDN